MNSSFIFSNPDYLLNSEFIHLMYRWHKYLGAENLDDDTAAQWEELLLKDFRKEAIKWLKENKRKTAWKKDLR